MHISGVSKELKEKVEIMSKETGLSISQIVITALNYYFEHEGRDYDSLYKILSDIFNPIVEELELIMLILNKLDVNSIMYKEFINHYFSVNGERLITTKDNYTSQLIDLENHVDSIVNKQRIKKIGR